MRTLILASASPRRKEILAQMGLVFIVCPSCGEEVITCTDPQEVVKELSLQKAKEVAARTKESALVIGSDTVVACDGEIMGKPVDEEDAFRMLKRLQNDTHMVFTGVSVIDTATGETLLNIAEGTQVSMYPMTDEWIRAYVATGEPMDKAGAYAIQGGCGPYIRGIHGEYSNVVGFPAARFYQEILKLGIDLLEKKKE